MRTKIRSQPITDVIASAMDGTNKQNPVPYTPHPKPYTLS